MYTKIATVKNPSGLHARPASEFVSCAKKFSSRLTVKRAGSEGPGVSGKSIVLLLSQGMAQGTEVELSAEGEDEAACVDALTALMDSGFGEL